MVLIQRFQYSLLAFLLMLAPCAVGQIETFRVHPNQVDANYSASEDSIAISQDFSLRQNKLFLFLGGTGSNSSIAYDGLRRHAADLGFDVINLSYPNDIAAASLKDSPDSLAFNKYREEICFGTPISDVVAVDSLNSIATRTVELLRYLVATRPVDGWEEYLTSTASVDWSKVIVGGHSQGAGHTAYLGKRFSMERVLMFSGPNDYSDQFSNSANWLRTLGATPTARHYAYLSLNDEIVDFSKQFANLSGLGFQDSTYVDNIASPYKQAQLLYTTQSIGLNHSVPARFSAINRDVWTYMLTASIASGVQEFAQGPELVVYPNPTRNLIRLRSPQNLAGKTYTLQNVIGLTILSGKLSNSFENRINMSSVSKGLYFLVIDGQKTSVVKE